MVPFRPRCWSASFWVRTSPYPTRAAHLPSGIAVWVDVPRNVAAAYAPTPEMIERLVAKALPGTVRALMLANRDAWKKALMWDDSAALYMLHLDRFAPKGAHQEPTASPADVRTLWSNATNRLNLSR
jgi:hypothetical protein